ncbi:16S rRNA (cytosine(1402)-N(4))-methyltransferase RsmH [Helicobacter sp. MIT 21-1697]|uniref:16S rRNA (cytosine(1402)-N(4))-methyltransferase RsmH n=1 Tax=Helicobacter sp. MIT 21-1697 TaxID=2993733 RepID=UPI00224B3EF7|nr:16S rRNA (cytosine(1402)-N(4))-methyltransferase RsmH [Helicobacter sp. MIT 21-1697]MCX2717176.1 16S rRNA (cytosine(1402)-N(4))-methyltransferase RsmH [Helicobacter sp. MIT 21-1697]
MKHYSVLKNEIIQALDCLREDSILIDCTLGFGGHTLGALQTYPNIEVYAFDKDIYALNLAKERLKPYVPHIHFCNNAFSEFLDIVPSAALARVRGIIADIGVSSMQLDEAQRGFSFASPTLDMRMDTRAELNATKVINTYSSARLEEIFRIYGEVRQSKKLTELITHQRKTKPFSSCYELSTFIEGHFPRIGGIHPATLAFQALRIEVNDELGELKRLLHSIELAFDEGKLASCRVGIISFHSLEDRIIKQCFKQWSKSCICAEESLRCECGNNHAKGQILTKKPITPTPQEIAQNKRSRSAKLRIFDLQGKI